MRRALTLLVFLLAAAPAQAQDLDRNTRASATEALQTAQRLAHGRGVRSGRELSPALQQLAAQRSELSSTQRAQADALLARPTDPGDVMQPGGPYSPGSPVSIDCSDANFCVHWVVKSGDLDAISTADTSPMNGRPDYVDDMIESFQTSFAVENTQLGWIRAKSDGTLGRDGDPDGLDKTDVYIKDIGGEGIFGYASTDPNQGSGT